MEQSSTIAVVLLDHFFSNLMRIAKTIYNKNNSPCAIPTILFGSGDSNIYLRGMVTNKINKYEIPSRKLRILKAVIINF